MVRWSKIGWEQLETIAFNAYSYTGFKSSAINVMNDARRVGELIDNNPRIGQRVHNIFGEPRFWYTFHNGKVLVWKADGIGPYFVGAFYHLPELLYV